MKLLFSDEDVRNEDKRSLKTNGWIFGGRGPMRTLVLAASLVDMFERITCNRSFKCFLTRSTLYTIKMILMMIMIT